MKSTKEIDSLQLSKRPNTTNNDQTRKKIFTITDLMD